MAPALSFHPFAVIDGSVEPIPTFAVDDGEGGDVILRFWFDGAARTRAMLGRARVCVALIELDFLTGDGQLIGHAAIDETLAFGEEKGNAPVLVLCH